MRKKDSAALLEIAVALNVGDEAQAHKMRERLWRVRRWATEQGWHAEAAKDERRRGILERLCTSVDDALHALEDLKAAAPASVETAPVVAPVADSILEPTTTEEKIGLAVDVAKRGVTA